MIPLPSSAAAPIVYVPSERPLRLHVEEVHWLPEFVEVQHAEEVLKPHVCLAPLIVHTISVVVLGAVTWKDSPVTLVELTVGVVEPASEAGAATCRALV